VILGNLIPVLTWSPDSRQFAYGFQQDNYYSLVIENADGSGNTHFRHDDYDGYIQPQWSPNGNMIVFQTRWSDKIVLFSLTDSSFTTLLEPEGSPRDPQWSPNGLIIAYALGSSPNPGIYIVDIDGTDNRCITQEVVHYRYPVWSPDGLKISYGSRGIDNNHKFSYYDLSTGEETTIDETMDNYVTRGTWSFDSNLLAYTRKSNGISKMVVYNLETKNSKEIKVGDFSVIAGSFRP
jgi:TolB protein